MSITQIGLGICGVVLMLAGWGVWTGHALIGLVPTQSGYQIVFGTSSSFSEQDGLPFHRAARFRACVMLAAGAALTCALPLRPIESFDIRAMRFLWTLLIGAFVAAIGVRLVVKGAMGMWFGRNPALVWVKVGRLTAWLSSGMTRQQALRRMNSQPVDSHGDPSSEKPAARDTAIASGTGIPLMVEPAGDPVEEIGEEALATALPSRLTSAYILTIGVLLLALLLTHGGVGGILTNIVYVATTLVWGAAVVMLGLMLFGGVGASAIKAAAISALGLTVGWLLGIAPEPLAAAHHALQLIS